MDDQTKNLILATVLSFLAITIWFVLFPPEPQVTPDPATETSQTDETADPLLPSADTSGSEAVLPGEDASADDDLSIANAPRIDIDTPSLEGSIALLGGRIDDLHLKNYRETLDDDAEIVTLLRPEGTPQAYFALHGWVPLSGVDAENVPGPETLWTVEGNETLTVDTPVSLTWDNGAGLVFRKTISVDEDFMFSIRQSVENTTEDPVSVSPYSLLRRQGEIEGLKGFFILHEGLVRVTDGTLETTTYDNMTDYDVDPNERVPAERLEATESGWIGFTDHYWMTTIVPGQGTPFRSTAKYFPGADIYQAEAVYPRAVVAPGETLTADSRLFAGAKEWEAIRNYQNQSGIERFLDSIDWGWFFFLTKPIFWLLHNINAFIGNMGWSIILLTLVIKAALLPLAFKSYVSMAKMKELQPEMEELKKRAGDNREEMQKGMMKLYKDNKVNPASGCLPILMQIPIFFSLYKVIFVTLELRHAPWIGWINDLSAPDPSSIFNLFGLLPFAIPELGFLEIFSLGILPIFLGVSMWLQQKLNPAPTDATQKMIFAWMPWVFMFMLGSFASGLVLYWIANNVITFSQQYLIMRSQGYKPDVLGNIKGSFNRSGGEKETDKK